MFKPKGPYCQSCGMPLSKDEKGGGSEADGSKSAEFCSHCYAAGKFTEPEITATLESARRTTQAHPEPNGREAEGAI